MGEAALVQAERSDAEALGADLRALRKSRNLTLAELADSAGDDWAEVQIPTRPIMTGWVQTENFTWSSSNYYVQVDGCPQPIAVAAQNVDSTIVEDAFGEGEVWLSWSDKAVVLLPATEG